jgi:hypothetical protein
VAYSRLAGQLAAVVYRLGLVDATDDALRATAEESVAEHFATRDLPWAVELLDAVLAGRRTDEPVPCPGGYLDGENGLFYVLLGVHRDLRLDLRDDHWTWVLPRLNLVLRVTSGPDSEYTLTDWAAPYPPLTAGLATILHRLGLTGAEADDDALRADVHEAVTDNLVDRDAPAWMTELVDAILHGRHSEQRVTVPALRPDGMTVIRNILADLDERFTLAIVDDGEWWGWTMRPLGLYLWVDREVSGGVEQYLLRPLACD